MHAGPDAVLHSWWRSGGEIASRVPSAARRLLPSPCWLPSRGIGRRRPVAFSPTTCAPTSRCFLQHSAVDGRQRARSGHHCFSPPVFSRTYYMMDHLALYPRIDGDPWSLRGTSSNCIHCQSIDRLRRCATAKLIRSLFVGFEIATVPYRVSYCLSRSGPRWPGIRSAGFIACPFATW